MDDEIVRAGFWWGRGDMKPSYPYGEEKGKEFYEAFMHGYQKGLESREMDLRPVPEQAPAEPV